MLPQEIIRKKRDGLALSQAEIEYFVSRLTSGAISEGQAAALAMAIFFNGMSPAECAVLTRAMQHSGESIDWSHSALQGPVLDKHSTGGVGDNVSLILAPTVASCGGFVPKIAGRGLGHTGGTIDKLESIPGYCATPDLARFRTIVRDIGYAIIGQTSELAPADQRLYAIRDVTATVESIPLITASILSKKLAAGVEGLVMDIKTGSGAFMTTAATAHALQQSLAHVAQETKLPLASVMTDMNEPLASAAGNAVEVDNAIAFLTGDHRDPRLERVVLTLGSEMLMLGKLASDRRDAEAKLIAAIGNGAAAERFQRMIAALGGPTDLIERRQHYLPAAPIIRAIAAPCAGVVTAIDVRAVGLAVTALGGGRSHGGDSIDPAVGFTRLRRIGERISAGEPLALVHARSDSKAAAAAAALAAAYRIDDAGLEGIRDPIVGSRSVPA